MTLLRVLGEREVGRIHEHALHVLAETGLLIHDDEVVTRLTEAGALVHHENGRRRVTIPSQVVEDGLGEAPKVVTLYNRMGEEAMVLGSGRLHARSSSGATAMLDQDGGQRRKATRQDAAHAVRLADSLSNVHGVSTMAVQPADVPASTVDVHTVRLALANTAKPLGYVCLNEGLIEAVVAMVAVVAGGEKRLRDRPMITALAESTSPLQLVSSQLSVLKAFASRRLPLTLHAHPIAGLTAPVTLAGELVITHAEVLGLMTIAQLIGPGTPVVYGMSSSVPDMRNAANLSGAVEIGLLGVAVSQLARHCGVPCVVSSGSDAHQPGAQSVMERLMTLLPPALAGVGLINLSTLETKMSFSLEQLVIDDAIVGMVQRFLRGIAVEGETLALDLIKRVGPAGSFVAEEHTFEYYRDELLTCELIEHQPREAWQAAGAPDLESRAGEKVERLLAEHQPSPLPSSVVAELDDIVDAVEDEGGSPW
ncbi:MAG: trimethylamine methyltransferase family protein [Anaerolineae bacterium]